MMDIVGALEGRVEIFADKENRERLISFFINNGIRLKIRYDEKNEGIFTEVSPSLLKKIAPALDKSGIIVYINNIYGFRYILNVMAKRIGIPIGAALFAAVLWVSTLFVWRVDIVGNDILTKESLRNTLVEHGISEGAFISRINESEIADIIVTSCPEISWASVNIKGTTVTLNVLETHDENSSESEKYDMLVAQKSGVVRSIEIFSGKAAVKIGAVVKQGDLLVLGYISGNGLQISETPALRYEGARGSVKAEVSETLEVLVPFERELIFQTGGKIKGGKLSVFGKELTLGDMEDGICSGQKRLTVFGEIELPILYTVNSAVQTVTENTVFSEQDARLEAERAIYQKVLETCGSGELTSVRVSYVQREDGIIAQATITYITEIAVGKTLAQ